MVFCCVPSCAVDKWNCDSSVTFHDFPSNPDLTAKWIKQINAAIKTNTGPMWFPRGKPQICSKHFLQTDFKDDTDTLKPRSIPTIFGHKFIGFNENVSELQNAVNENKSSPLIVKVNKPSCDPKNLITNVYSARHQSQNGDENTISSLLPHSKTLSRASENSFLGSLHPKNSGFGLPINSCVPSFQKTVGDTTVKNKWQGTQKGYMIRKKNTPKHNSNDNLIEIGPNTFLKINPDIIKVNKKLTQSGNTVLQFIMDQKLATSSQVGDLLPKLVHGVPIEKEDTCSVLQSPDKTGTEAEKTIETVVQHVVGHLVDTHVCNSTCSELHDIQDEAMPMEQDIIHMPEEIDNNKNVMPDSASSGGSTVPRLSAAHEKIIPASASPGKGSNVLSKAPVLFTTSIPLSHCLTDKNKYSIQLKQKTRQIASLKFKAASLAKKVEELEDRCIVQERQLSYSFIKRLKAIRKNAAKGDPCATYILEQVRAYSGKTKMRWSNSTLSQCAVWCRKAPYAYEYFKKAEFFKLPCLGTVKRFMKKHPEMKFQNKANTPNPVNSSSSSDFDFDESDEYNKENSDVENIEPSASCEVILSDTSRDCNADQVHGVLHNSVDSVKSCTSVSLDKNENTLPSSAAQVTVKTEKSDVPNNSEKHVEISSFPVSIDESNVEIQEIILPSGEVVQCYSSRVCNGNDGGNQYYIIPNVSDQSHGPEQGYNIVQTAESLPVILQNIDSGQLPMQQEQLIFITNSTEQVECTEAEVETA